MVCHDFLPFLFHRLISTNAFTLDPHSQAAEILFAEKLLIFALRCSEFQANPTIWLNDINVSFVLYHRNLCRSSQECLEECNRSKSDPLLHSLDRDHARRSQFSSASRFLLFEAHNHWIVLVYTEPSLCFKPTFNPFVNVWFKPADGIRT